MRTLAEQQNRVSQKVAVGVAYVAVMFSASWTLHPSGELLGGRFWGGTLQDVRGSTAQSESCYSNCRRIHSSAL